MPTETEVCQIRGQVSRDSRYWAKLLQKDTCDSDGETLKNHVRITYGLTLGRGLKKPLKKRENQECTIEVSKLEYDRNFKRIYPIDPSDEDYKDIIKNTIRKLETTVTAALPCKREFSKVSIRHIVVPNTEKVKASETKTRFSCIAEAHKSTRRRIELMKKRSMKNTLEGKNSIL